MHRYERNKIITSDEQEKLKKQKVCIVGCGGLGGYIIEMLARFGVGHLTVVDGDVFDPSNLNRQILCLMNSVGKSKAFTAAERIEAIDPNITVDVIATFVEADNARDILKNHDVVVDALDSNQIRFTVLEMCKELDIPCVHGAIAGWYGQVSTVFPEDNAVRNYLKTVRNKGIELNTGNPSFTPACVASYQASQVLKILLKKGNLLREKILFVDLLNDEFEIIEFRE